MECIDSDVWWEDVIHKFRLKVSITMLNQCIQIQIIGNPIKLLNSNIPFCAEVLNINLQLLISFVFLGYNY